eukprot:10854418-Karenia_brevis.AAC.1
MMMMVMVDDDDDDDNDSVILVASWCNLGTCDFMLAQEIEQHGSAKVRLPPRKRHQLHPSMA